MGSRTGTEGRSRLPWRRAAVPDDIAASARSVGAGRVLGWSRLPVDGWAAATGPALLVVAVDAGTPEEPLQVPWYLVSSAAWENGVLEVAFAPRPGAPAELLRLEVDEHGLLAEAVNTLVTGAVAWRGHVDDAPLAAATFSARRPPEGDLLWSVRFDPGYDAADPALQRWADEQIARLREVTGL